MADGEWSKVCALMTAPVPNLQSRLLPASLLQDDGARTLWPIRLLQSIN